MRLNRICATEWVLGLGGVAVIVGLFLPWSEGSSGFGSFNALILLLALTGLAALLVPAVVAGSRLTDVPIVWETLLWLASLLLLAVFVVVVFLTPPSLAWGVGMWITLAGLVTVGLAGWRSVRRES